MVPEIPHPTWCSDNAGAINTLKFEEYVADNSCFVSRGSRMDISDRLSPHDLVVLEGDLAFIRPDLQQLIYGLFEIEGVYSVLLEENTVRINPYNVRDYEDNQLDPLVFDSVSRLIRAIWEMPTDESDCEFMSPEDRQAQREEWWPDLLGT